MMALDLFSEIKGQDQVTGYLHQVYEKQVPTHAYLIAGSDTELAGKIAHHFAASLIADNDSESFDEALRLVHPDLHVYEPAGAQSYLVDQIRELTHDAELAPIRAKRKVYVVNDAHVLSGAPANAFLKTLEEPPQNVVCILTARSEAAVLETLKSRCVVLTLHASSDTPPEDPRVMDMLIMLARGCDNRTLLSYAKDLVEYAKERAGQEVDESMNAEAYIEKYEDFLTQGAKKQLEQQEKRDTTARERASLLAMLSFIRRWLRDCIAAKAGCDQVLSYPQFADETMQVARKTSDCDLMQALSAVNTTASRISYNVTPQLAIEAMFLEIREALCRK